MKLIAIDLDGTLLNSNQVISERNIQSLKHLDKDMFPFICSGRDVHDILNILEEAELNILAVGLNGAVAYDKDKLLFESFFDKRTICEVEKILEGFPLKVYTNQGSYESDDYEKRLESLFNEIGSEYDRSYLDYELDYEKTISSTPFQTLSELLEIEGCSIYKIFMFIPNSVKKIQINKRLAGVKALNATESAPTNIEILPQSVSKGNVYSMIEEIYKFDKSTRIAIGDSLNDLSLFEEAKYKYAMENAHQSLKKLSTMITPSNDDDEVSEAILHISKEIVE